MVRFLGSGGCHDTRATVSLFLSMSVLLLMCVPTCHTTSVLLLMTSLGDRCAFWELGIRIGPLASESGPWHPNRALGIRIGPKDRGNLLIRFRRLKTPKLYQDFSHLPLSVHLT